MENSNEKEEYEDCYEDQNEKEKNETEENNNKK